MSLTRREVLRGGGAGLALFAASGCLGRGGARAFAGEAGSPLLVVIFLRGGADALHLVPPVGDLDYGFTRQSLALDSHLPFVPGFGLHPAFEPAMGLVDRQMLAVVPCAGSPHPTRSHFEAQDFMEAGEPGSVRLADGWMARALRGNSDADLFATLALTGSLPLSLRGSGSFALDEAGSLGIPGASESSRDLLAAMYRAESDTALGRSGLRALAAVDEAQQRLGRSGRRRLGRGASRGEPLNRSVEQLIALDASGLAVRAAFLESSGWDTHANQGGSTGTMARLVGDLASALARLDEACDGRREWLAVVHTEFGRTARPNGSGGTDHGHGSAMLVAGSGARGGIQGPWPGLASKHLYEGRDLAVLVDYRSVLVEVLSAHLGAKPPGDTFPGFDSESVGVVRGT